jgi:alpha-glucoside transport system permease protein
VTTGEGAALPGRRSDLGRMQSVTAGEGTPAGTTATAGGVATAGGSAAPVAPKGRKRSEIAPKSWIAYAFLLPALLLLAVLVLYPILYSIKRSLFDALGTHFVGLDNYKDMFTSAATRTAIKNNAIWVLIAPVLVTALGLVFAVLTERVRWATAFKLVVFMPMAVSFLATGIIFRLVYDSDPSRGLANAVITGVKDIFGTSTTYPNARPRNDQVLTAVAGGGYQTSKTFGPGDTAALPLVGVQTKDLPTTAQDAAAPAAAAGQLNGTVWFDFTRGGGGTAGAVDPGEKGLPSVKVEAVRDGSVAATAKTDKAGHFSFGSLPAGSYTLRLPNSNFAEAFGGVNWLGPTLATWSIIGAYIWIWAGFAMVLIAAGLAAIPRDALEAARVDGGTEWQVFRRVTVPLLAPVLLVVVVTLMINVLKVFDLVLILAPQSSQDDANVLALEMWRVSFGGANNQGLGSALGLFLFVLVLPAMIFNVRRFRREQQ